MTPLIPPIEVQQLTEATKSLVEALRNISQPSAAADPEFTFTIPPIGNRYLGGIYAGVARGFDGEPDGHIILLDDTPSKDLNWADAVKWAESLGDGARLPTRFESALLYANVRDQLVTDEWHWTSTQDSAGFAWMQYFGYGNQDISYKFDTGRARAVRRLIL